MNLNFFKNREAKTFLAWLYVIGGLAGLKASFALTLDKMELLKNPHFVPNCSINPIISCGSVMKTAQASIFGFDNTLLGVAAFAAIVTIGFSILAGANYKAWFWKLFTLGGFLGALLVHWFFYESIWKIGAVCPWCMLVDLTTIAIFWYTLLFNLKQGYIRAPKPLATAVKFAQEYKHVILILWYLAIIGTIVGHFWYYFKTVI
jgi:uncharacterized membrane protein